MKTIKITKEDKFIWKIVNPTQARVIFDTAIFNLYELHDNDAESLITSLEELEKVVDYGGLIGIEVGLLNKKEK